MPIPPSSKPVAPADPAAAGGPRTPTDADVLVAVSTFPNGCDFTLHFKSDARVFIGYGCYGVHWNLVQGSRYRMSRWLGFHGEPREIDLKPETIRQLKLRKPCRLCGGFTFEPLEMSHGER